MSDLKKVVSKEMPPPPCDKTINLTVLSAGNGVAKGVWQVEHAFVNGLGVAMGGFLSSAADIMMAYAIASVLTDEQTFASIDLHTTYHRPVVPGKVQVEARVERLGKQVAYLVAELTQDGKKVATAVSHMIIARATT
ncbi:PaaI family thioesterase [Caldalkalibacillus thermarum TA2.A1]|nr:PaaI family thioesterase [Caldalkalibacillus thermarum TA2.A1]